MIPHFMSKNKIYQKFGEKIKDKTFAHFSSLWDKFRGLGGGGYHFEICLSETKYEQMFFRTEP